MSNNQADRKNTNNCSGNSPHSSLFHSLINSKESSCYNKSINYKQTKIAMFNNHSNDSTPTAFIREQEPVKENPLMGEMQLNSFIKEECRPHLRKSILTNQKFDELMSGIGTKEEINALSKTIASCLSVVTNLPEVYSIKIRESKVALALTELFNEIGMKNVDSYVIKDSLNQKAQDKVKNFNQNAK